MSKKIVIIGGGIVGLATAYKLQEIQPTADITVLDKENDVAQHQTGNNSGVIHSGIYYKPGSLKALNCKRGYQMLLDFCQAHGVRHEITGKIISATRKEELPLLDNIFQRGIENGLANIRKISTEEAQEIEPYVNCLQGVFVPQSGIVYYTEVAQKFRELVLQKGANLVLGAKTIGIVPQQGTQHVVQTTSGDFLADTVLNCAGLHSDEIARMTVPDFKGQILPFRGEYYELKHDSAYLVKNLIYPVPNPNFPFLGVHFTRMMKGGVEAGPNAVLAYAREGYTKSTINWGELGATLGFPGFRKVALKYWRDGAGELYRSYSKAAFVQALQNLLPAIKSEHLVPGGAGVRAQLCMPDGSLVDDFLILQKPGVINVVNAPSPAATASLAIGAHIAALVK